MTDGKSQNLRSVEMSEHFFERSERYFDQGKEAYRLNSEAGRQLFIRYRFYLMGLIVASIAFATVNRDLSVVLWKSCPELTSVRCALSVWAVGVVVGLWSIQTTITSYFLNARGDSQFYYSRAKFSGLAARQNQRLAGGFPADPALEKEIETVFAELDDETDEIHAKQKRIISAEFWLSGICASSFFIGAAVYSIPLFR